MAALGRLLPFKTLPPQRPLWVGSGYWQQHEVKFRYPPESGYTIGVIFSETYICFRPQASLGAVCILIGRLFAPDPT